MIAEVVSRRYPMWVIRAVRVGLFAVLVALSARVRIEIAPNVPPITAQTLMIFITGMVLGPLEGALSVSVYVAAIALGAPLDTRGLGPLVFWSVTAGYLVGFVPAAFVAGLAWRAKQHRLLLNVICGLAAMVVILAFGTIGVAAFRQMSLDSALIASVFPFILIEPGKVLLAASLVNLGNQAWQRWMPSNLLLGN
ncbi:MAG: biotin transporter BioY [Chloroflexota bacterium]